MLLDVPDTFQQNILPEEIITQLALTLAHLALAQHDVDPTQSENLILNLAPAVSCMCQDCNSTQPPLIHASHTANTCVGQVTRQAHSNIINMAMPHTRDYIGAEPQVGR